MAKGTCRSIEIEQWVSGGGGEPLLGRLAPGCGLAPSHEPVESPKKFFTRYSNL